MAQRNKISFEGQNIYIGIDVHRTTWSVTVLTEHANFEKTITQESSPQKLFDFLIKQYPGGNYHAVYEAGFSGFSTYYALTNLGIGCIVINPSDVPTTNKEKQMKTDATDSGKLARSLRSGELTPIYIMPRERLDDRGVVRTRLLFQRQLSGYKCRVKCLLYSQGITTYPEQFSMTKTHWSHPFMQWLREVPLLSEERKSLDLIVEEVDHLRASVLRTARVMRLIAATERYNEDYKNLLSIPGIGYITAMTLLTEIVDISRFANERDFTGYLGLVPTCNNSGDKIRIGDMTSRGNKFMRTMLIEASWVAIRKDQQLFSLYCKHCKRMEHNKAIVRVARRLGHICYATLKNKIKYDPNR